VPIMPITFVPHPGAVLMCDFTGFRPPEMTKLRHVVVLSKRSRVSFPDTYIVVPISKTPPNPAESCHCEFRPRSYDFFDPVEAVWAKGNMVTCVAKGRLDRVKISGRYTDARIRAEDLLRVRRSVLYALGMEDWGPAEKAVEALLRAKASTQDAGSEDTLPESDSA
jgi:uncharacterized protein YifN (PemK superfamily)